MAFNNVISCQILDGLIRIREKFKVQQTIGTNIDWNVIVFSLKTNPKSITRFFVHAKYTGFLLDVNDDGKF